jgi:hypothetical protein
MAVRLDGSTPSLSRLIVDSKLAPYVVARLGPIILLEVALPNSKISSAHRVTVIIPNAKFRRRT